MKYLKNNCQLDRKYIFLFYQLCFQLICKIFEIQFHRQRRTEKSFQSCFIKSTFFDIANMHNYPKKNEFTRKVLYLPLQMPMNVGRSIQLTLAVLKTATAKQVVFLHIVIQLAKGAQSFKYEIQPILCFPSCSVVQPKIFAIPP